MKQIKIIFLLVLILSTMASIACSDKADTRLIAVENISEYTIVRSDIGSKAATDATIELRNVISEALGLELKLATDWVKRGEESSIPADGKEILIGTTNRPGTEKASQGLRGRDFRVSRDGNRIFITAGSDEALLLAVEYIRDNFIDSQKGSFSLPENGEYTMKNDYLLDSLSVNGVDFSDYKIAKLSSHEKNDALLEKIRVFASERLGFDIEISSSYSDSDSGHYIVIDDSSFIADEWSIRVEDGKIRIRGSYSSIEAAVEYFCTNYFGEFETKQLELADGDSKSGSTGKREIYSKEQLMDLLTEVYNDPNLCIIGEENLGGNDHPIPSTLKRFYDATGDYPGILGIDLSGYGFPITRYDDSQQSKLLCELTDYCANGGIVTISCHFDNPSGNYGTGDRMRGNLGYDDTKEGYEKAFRDLITEGTELNEKFKQELDVDARFLKALGDNGVPVLWRPLHEQNGNWFWFCTTQNGKTMDSSAIRELWIYIYKYYTEVWKLDNLIWVFSPNVSSNLADKPGGAMSTTYCYPGDEYVDMVGCDWYSQGELELATQGYRELVEKSKMIGAITEFGPSGIILADKEKGTKQGNLYTAMDLYDDMLELKEKGFKFAYLLTWHTIWSVPDMTRGDELMSTDYALGQSDLAQRFAQMK